MDISIIVPLYYGKEYLGALCSMLRKCIDNALIGGATTEVIFVNDSPDECIDFDGTELKSNEYKYIVNDKNQGIHYSRVRGVKESKGDYIVFLDQDDILSPNYLETQSKNIGNADVSICLGYEFGTIIQNGLRRISNCDVVDNYEDIVNTYLGTELIKKTSIPDIWFDNIIKINSADDVFLNSLLVHNKKKFSFCERKLYCHVSTGKNASLNFEQNINSLKEVNAILLELGIISKREYDRRIIWGEEWLRNNNTSIEERKKNYNLRLLDVWMRKIEEKYTLDAWLLSHDIKKVSIFGIGVLGKHLYDQLYGSNVSIVNILDNYVEKYKGMVCCKFGEDIKQSDLIIVAVFDSSQFLIELFDRYKIPVITLETILSSMVYFD